ncbi:MAG: ADOP family duplicated permease [Gemmatimonadaceae bacterium]
MSWADGVLHRVRTLLRPDEYERDLDEEMRHHVELDEAQQRDRDRARKRFGNRTYYREEARNMTWLRFVDVLEQDARFAVRSLKRNPGVTALIVVTFALGIGVNAATFSLLDRIYLRPPPGVAEPSSIHRLWWLDRQPGSRVQPASTYPVVSAIRESWGDPQRLVIIDASSGGRLGGTRAGPAVQTQFATANYFDVLGVRPQIGRFYTADEDRIGHGAKVAVLSDHAWRRYFDADSSVVGREIKLDEDRLTVIGVAARKFTGIELRPVDVWMPLASLTDQATLQGPMAHRYFGKFAFARVNNAGELAQLQRHATLTAHEVIGGSKTNIPYATIEAATGPIIYSRGPGEQNKEQLISTRLSAVALIVLVIAAANVVNLLLARATRRRREIAVRLALGVGRWRLVRMLTAETLLLALIAATAALLAAWWGGTALRALLLPDVTFVDSALDGRVVWFTLGLAVLAGIAAGVIPALQSTAPNLTLALKEGAREGTVHHSRLRTALVITQAALSVVLLVGASLFVRSLQNVRGLDVGFDVQQLVIGQVQFDPGQSPPPPERSARMAQIAQRLGGRSGILSTSLSVQVPMGGASYGTFWFGNDSSNSIQQHRPTWYAVDDKYFTTAGIRLVQGRVFDERRGAAPEVVVNQDLAALIWPGRDPIGQCLSFDRANGTCHSVVGVVEPSRTMAVVEPNRPQFFLPIANLPPRWGDERRNSPAVLLVRTTPELAARVIAEVGSELKNAFPTGYPNVRLMTAELEADFRPWRVGALLFSGFGALALIVAVLGIYSTVSYGVSQRTHEFGVRVALGARVVDVLRLVVGEGLRKVAIGVVFGVALALAAGRLVATLLYGISPTDPRVLLSVSFALLFVAVVATLVPAWRASRVDPTTALRAD